MVQRFSDYSLPIIVSLIIHFFVIGAIFISLVPQDTVTFIKKKIKETTTIIPANTTEPTPLPAPVVLYYANGHKSSVLSPAQTKSNPSLKNLPPESLQKLEGKKEETIEKAKQKSIEKKEKNEQKKSPTVISSVSETGFFKATENPSNLTQKQETTTENQIRSRQLELADLFKSMPHYPQTEGHSNGTTDQLLVVQGDMKYYSFFNQFLNHINQVFAFHGGPEKLSGYIQSGKRLKNAGLFVIIDQQGKVLSRSITSSSGYAPADALILQVVDLASPFPPVPQHFNHKTVRIELISMIR